MKKILFLLRTVTLCFFLSGYTSSYPEPVSIEDNPVNEVASLVGKLAMSGPARSKKILSEINAIRKKYPENIAILLMYTNSLIGEKHYKEGIELLRDLYSKKPARTYLLTECMLRQRTGDKQTGCYQEVVRLSEQQNLMDSDYVTALFFTDTKKFSTVKQQLIKDNTFKESDFLIFTLGEEKMLHEFFP